MNDRKKYHRVDQFYAFHGRGFDIGDIRRSEDDEGSGVVGIQDVRQGLFDGLITVDFVVFVKDILFLALVILDPVFIKQGGNITAEFGNLIAEGDIIFISRSNV